MLTKLKFFTNNIKFQSIDEVLVFIDRICREEYHSDGWLDKDISLDKREFEKYSLLKEKDACDKLFFSSHKKFLGLIASDIKKGNYAKIIVLSGPGGSGKETVIEAVCKKTNIQRAKTVTTRKQNKDENSSGRIFVDENKFLQMRTRGDFIETNHFKEN